ncbi:MAG: DUF2846 domain-containing protein [Deltaproteobacteria bacterium]|nr:DUF2846 domain-containing protein [Deltaproteobacteria bacterium]
MKRIHVVVLISALLIIVSGCATIPVASSEDDALAKRFVADPDRSLIYLFRNEYFGAAIPMQVSIDGQVAGRTVAYSFFKWDVPPGEHVIKSFAENESSLSLVTKPGKVYFVRQEVKMGVWLPRSQLYEVNEQQGMAAINECKLVTSDAFDAVKRSRLVAAGKIEPPVPLKVPSSPEKKEVASLPDGTLVSEQPPGAGGIPEKKVQPERVRKSIPPSGYTKEYAPVVSSMIGGAFDAALESADKNYQRSLVKDGPQQDRYLKLLEKGKTALVARKYDQSIADLQEAEKRFLTIEGTISITEGLGSLVTDDTVQEYEPEVHEKLMIPPYLVLAYLGKGDFEGARVERNKTINKIHQYIEEKPERAYLENPFARFLSAVVYEMEGKYDDARIEYRKMKRDDEIARLEKKKDKTTDLIIFTGVGMTPQKYEEKWGPTSVPAGLATVTLGFAYAGYNAMESTVSDCTIKIDGKPMGKTSILYDIEKTIFEQYEKNKSVMISKLVARMTSKAAAQVGAQMAAEKALENIPFASMFAKTIISEASKQWIAAEQADLRSWITLPRQIQYVRIDGLTPGEHTIVVEYNGGSQVHKVTMEEGKIRVAYFSVAR